MNFLRKTDEGYFIRLFNNERLLQTIPMGNNVFYIKKKMRKKNQSWS